MREIKISFPKNQQVKTSWDNFEVITDQPVKYGGDGEYPEPFMYFLSSIAACGGYYLLKFCEARHIDYNKINMTMAYSWEDKEKGNPCFEIKIELPEDFEDKYISPLQKAVEQCTVKKAIQANPVFKVTTKKR
jgi:ribosomal protein S12 methylthiotransferase accessory factor